MEPNSLPPSQPPRAHSEALTQRMKSDTCFKCQNKGHWARDCPLHSPDASPSKTTPSNDIPVLHCGCGAACTVRTSRTPENPNRQFYVCVQCSQSPNEKRKRYGFGGWCDEFNAPECPCRIGKCRIYTASEHDNRKYFGCRIKRGFGGCDFRQLVDEQGPVMAMAPQRLKIEPPILLNRVNHAELADIDQEEEIEELLHSKKLDEMMLSLSVPQQKTTEELEGMVIEDRIGTTSPDSVLEDLTMEEAALDQISQNEVVNSRMRPEESEIHSLQEDFMKQIFAVGDGLTVGIFPSLSAMYESNDMTVIDNQGCSLLMDAPLAPGPNDCLSRRFLPSGASCLSGSFLPSDESCLSGRFLPSDPFNLKQVMQFDCPKRIDDEKVTQLLVWLAQQLNGGAMNQLPAHRTGGRYTELLQRTAADVQNKFIAQLDVINPLDIDLLRNEAVVCFTTLGLLRSLDCGEFICRVMHYIECASSLAKIERSVNSDPSLQLRELRDRQIYEQKQHEDLSQLHLEKWKACSASEERRRVLKENAARYREMLRQTEGEIANCEAELSELERNLVEVNQGVKKSKKSMEAVAREVIEAQRKEMERAAAKDALEKARLRMR